MADSAIPIYSDQPVRSIAEDRLGFADYAATFQRLISAPRTPTPLTVAISGEWGSGKTSLGRLVEEGLRHPYDRRSLAPVTCWFNAWMHGDAPNLGAALAADVARTLARHRPTYWRLISPLPTAMLTPERRWLRRVGLVVTVCAVVALLVVALSWISPAVRDLVGPVGAALARWRGPMGLLALAVALTALVRRTAKIADWLGAFVDDPRSAAARGTIAEVRRALGRIVRQAGRGRRIVIFVDDLERCPPSKAVEVCEVAGQLLNHDGVITIFLADMDVIAESAGTRYATSTEDNAIQRGEEFLQKLVQIRFNLPPLSGADVAGLFTDAAETTR
jgi:hypothetical protein